jgi:glycerophosphoryl diester phosphodiesterase
MRCSNALAILMGLLVFAVFAAAGAAPAADLAGGPILNVGHRGSTGLAPEHTIASYDLALENGADYIEQDLRMTSAGVLVVL